LIVPEFEVLLQVEEEFQGLGAKTTTSGEGGNMTLRADESIILRFNSDITTEALGTGTGGNLQLEAEDFILAFPQENSDIVASAIQGRGGSIFARARGIFGFRQFCSQRTPLSDFTASSQFGIDGSVTLDVRDFQPESSMEDGLVDPEVCQGCYPARRSGVGKVAGSTFYETGRGDTPTDPGQSLSPNAVQVPWVEMDGGGKKRHRAEQQREGEAG